ncbi:unnamed protein product [Lupinus luteus]|uniref:Uncharacterized protein n=1 Tax=Lupinus luteus TaxID=3873 RepID=A0AAV1XDG9_LUPLU
MLMSMFSFLAEVVVSPPFVFLPLVKGLLRPSRDRGLVIVYFDGKWTNVKDVVFSLIVPNKMVRWGANRVAMKYKGNLL